MKKITLITAMLIAFVPKILAQCNENVPLPYAENFDSALPPDLPDCTYSYKQTFVGNDWECVAAPNSSFTGNVGRYSTYSDEAWMMWCDYIMRPVQLTAGMGYKVSYKYAHNDNETAIDALRVKLTSFSESTDIDLASHEQITGTEVVSFTTEVFTVPVTGNYYLRFMLETAGNQGILYLDDIKFEATGTMGITDNAVSAMSFYPNPVKDRLTIANTSGLETLELYNTAGQLIHKQYATDANTIMNLEYIPSGIYMLKTWSQDTSKTIQLIKE